MTVDKNNFFRKATLQICGHLEIEDAMQALLRFLREVMPVTTIFLQDYDYGYNAMRSIAYANQTECGKLDLLTPLSKVAQETAGDVPTHQDVFLFEDPQAFSVSREMLKFHNIEATSLIAMLIRSKEILLGSLVFITKGEQKFKDEHLKLLLLLKEPLAIAVSNTLKHREILKLKDVCADDNRYLHGELRRLSGDEIIGANFGLKDVMENVQLVAALDSPVLLLGETGVGKDVIANSIHYSSSRSKGPFVSVNCGAIPDTLIDSELFGHEKGAFTGALTQKRGRFERANKGTIFLDEIGELPPHAQVRMLSVLQNKEIERVGGSRPIQVDVRIIAATHRNLEEMIRSGQFREDLWFRINVFPVMIPPLRQRREDIPALVNHFIERKSKELKLWTSSKLAIDAIDRLIAYRWPGNVRELENVVERALILNKDGLLKFDQFIAAQQEKKPPALLGHENEPVNLDEIIAMHIQKVLKMTNGKVHGEEGAAELMGINPSTLRNRMNKLGIPFGRNAM